MKETKVTTIFTRRFLVESNGEGGGDFTGATTIRVWTLEEMLREINRDTTCTDGEGDVKLNDGSFVLAGSPLDTVDHEGDDCFRPYNEQDWEDGWYNWTGEEWHRLIREVNKFTPYIYEVAT